MIYPNSRYDPSSPFAMPQKLLWDDRSIGSFKGEAFLVSAVLVYLCCLACLPLISLVAVLYAVQWMLAFNLYWFHCAYERIPFCESQRARLRGRNAAYNVLLRPQKLTGSNAPLFRSSRSIFQPRISSGKFTLCPFRVASNQKVCLPVNHQSWRDIDTTIGDIPRLEKEGVDITAVQR